MDSSSLAGLCGAVSLTRALKVLALSERAMASLGKHIGAQQLKQARRMMMTGRLKGDLGADIHDFFMDEIVNRCDEVSRFMARGGYGRYSVCVYEYERVFFVGAPEFDNAGYFLRKEDAETYIYVNWGNSLIGRRSE